MAKKLGSLGIAMALLCIPLLVMVGLTLITSGVGMTHEIGIQEPPLLTVDVSSVPQFIKDDAAQAAASVSGDDTQKAGVLAEELVGSYVEASNKDVVIIFNSGGMGWNQTEDTPGWATILDGITAQLTELGYKSVVMNYRRTGGGFIGGFKEIVEAMRQYPNKVKDLVVRVQFLTDHLPNLRIIVAGESTGTVITDEAMSRLQNSPQVYSIQTGMPFWHKPSTTDSRTLLVNSNGLGEDTFSYGNVPAMLWATVKGWFGMTKTSDNPGNVLKWLRAPGHDYSWQYPGVYDAIVDFLQNNFGQGN
jgi:hypothetical protein